MCLECASGYAQKKNLPPSKAKPPRPDHCFLYGRWLEKDGTRAFEVLRDLDGNCCALHFDYWVFDAASNEQEHAYHFSLQYTSPQQRNPNNTKQRFIWLFDAKEEDNVEEDNGYSDSYKIQEQYRKNIQVYEILQSSDTELTLLELTTKITRTFVRLRGRGNDILARVLNKQPTNSKSEQPSIDIQLDYPYYPTGCMGSNWQVVASSTLAQQGKQSYVAQNCADGDARTAWVEGAKGSGIGEWLLFIYTPSCATQEPLSSIVICNGYGKSRDTYLNNNRVKKLKMSLNEEVLCVIELDDSLGFQHIDFDEGKAQPSKLCSIWLRKGDRLKFEILDIYKGAKYDDTAIADIIPHISNCGYSQ